MMYGESYLCNLLLYNNILIDMNSAAWMNLETHVLLN